jgi:hypothetical protein
MVAYPDYIKEKALQLRRERKMTIDEISECLAIPRTTIFYWVGPVPIPRTARQTAAQLERAREHKERHRLAREAAYFHGFVTYMSLIEEPGFRDFICMYIGEGYKRNRNVVSVSNSDRAVVKLADYWLRRLSHRKVTYAIQHHADQDPGQLRRFWSTELGADPDSISIQRKSNSNGLKGRKWRSEHGVVQVTVHDTLFRAELQAWIDAVRDEWEELPVTD